MPWNSWQGSMRVTTTYFDISSIALWNPFFFHLILSKTISVFPGPSCAWYVVIGSRMLFDSELTHWGRVTHICVSKLTIIGSDNGLSPDRRQAIIWTNDGISVIGPFGTNFSEILIKIHTFSFNKMHFKMSSGKRRPFCFGLNVLIGYAARQHDNLSCCKDSTTHLKIGYPSRKFTATSRT